MAKIGKSNIKVSKKWQEAKLSKNTFIAHHQYNRWGYKHIQKIALEKPMKFTEVMTFQQQINNKKC